MTKMTMKNFDEMAKVMTEACFKGVEIKKSDFIEDADGVTTIEVPDTCSQRILSGFGFVTC